VVPDCCPPGVGGEAINHDRHLVSTMLLATIDRGIQQRRPYNRETPYLPPVAASGARSGRVCVADAFADLLELIVRDYAITDAQKDVDLNASADEPAAVIEADKQQLATDAAERARQLYPSFRTGLLLAFEAQGIGRHEIRLDDRDAEQNAIADALIAYLVRFDFAESRSEETEPGHYDYFISVNWDSLYQLAQSAGIDLPAALARAASIPGG
jgi:hypothetical protein